MPLTCVKNLPFKPCTLLRFLSETGRNDDKGLGLLILSESAHGGRTESGRDDQYGKFGRREFGNVVKHLDAVHLIFPRVDYAQCACISAANDVADNSATRFMHIV